MRIACPASRVLAAGTLVDGEAFKAEDGREWQVMDSDHAVQACPRSDGRWRYVNLPLRLTQAFD